MYDTHAQPRFSPPVVAPSLKSLRVYLSASLDYVPDVHPTFSCSCGDLKSLEVYLLASLDHASVAEPRFPMVSQQLVAYHSGVPDLVNVVWRGPLKEKLEY